MKMFKRKKLVKYFLYLAVVTTLVTSSTLAKYASVFQPTGTAEIAAFVKSGTVNLDMALADLVPGTTKAVQFSVENFSGDTNSGVQLQYDIQVTTTGNLPLTFSLLGQKQSDDTSENSTIVGALDGELKAVGGRLPVAETEGRKTHAYELSVTWPSSLADERYNGEIDMLTVTIKTQQVQF